MQNSREKVRIYAGNSASANHVAFSFHSVTFVRCVIDFAHISPMRLFAIDHQKRCANIRVQNRSQSVKVVAIYITFNAHILANTISRTFSRLLGASDMLSVNFALETSNFPRKILSKLSQKKPIIYF